MSNSFDEGYGPEIDENGNLTRQGALQYLLECGEQMDLMLGDLEDDYNYICDQLLANNSEIDYLSVVNELLEPEE